ncbi:F-box/kelch-repeat protein At3g23880-like [Lotus japonicus]|uniref:F-box/kelch-repeat protein At3g23880-like n=1 Tax=Lotus japonicus TaxID=34305 RepID=UPI00258E634D|nr:F-box/kelch-repeat protein At3g23880-like [Lotus japonicus]
MEKVRNLPQELVENILVRLPCKSLMRFKCVCKHWFALLHYDTKFLSRHFIKNQNSAANDVLLKLPSHIVNDLKLEIYKLFSLSATGIGMETPIPPWPSKYFSRCYQICGHSNGIVCLSSLDYILLYNPLTREFRKLPPFTIEHSSRVAVGMGYDSFTDDFKVISIRKRQNATDYYARVVEQYTLSTDSWAVMPNTNVELLYLNYNDFAMCFNRTFYWWARYREDYSIVIVALNMDDGVFQMVPKPPGVNIIERNGSTLTVWNDSISLVCCSYQSPSNFDIWVMGGFGSWTHMRTIKHLTEEVPKPWVFWKGNELLMEMVSCGKITSYNVDTKESKDVLIKMMHTDGISCFQAVNYVTRLMKVVTKIKETFGI